MRCRFRPKQLRIIKKISMGKRSESGFVISIGMFAVGGLLAGFVCQLKCSQQWLGVFRL